MRKCFVFVILLLICVSFSEMRAQDYLNPVASAQTWMSSPSPYSGVMFNLPPDETDPTVSVDFRNAVRELTELLVTSSDTVLRIYVCGQTSPDGLWQDNYRIATSRMENAVRYIKEMTGAADDMILTEVRNEGWEDLYSMVAQSDLSYKNDVLRIIKTKSWGERKQYLKLLCGISFQH